MHDKLTCLSLATFVFVSCDKSGTTDAPDDTSSRKPQIENRAEAPTIVVKPAPARHDIPDTSTGYAIDPPTIHPATAEMIRPAGTAPGDTFWDTLTAGQKIEKFNSSGIARIPKDISDKILADASKAGTPGDQVNIITQQAAAWHHITQFKEDVIGIPDHMRMALLERLYTKHGGSWMDMVPELDEQVAASARVDEFRSKGIPGLTPDESQALIIQAIEKYGPDYKAILSVAEQSSKK